MLILIFKFKRSNLLLTLQLLFQFQKINFCFSFLLLHFRFSIFNFLIIFLIFNFQFAIHVLHKSIYIYIKFLCKKHKQYQSINQQTDAQERKKHKHKQKQQNKTRSKNKKAAPAFHESYWYMHKIDKSETIIDYISIDFAHFRTKKKLLEQNASGKPEQN